MSKIIITSDSTTDLGEELLNRYNIKTLPLVVTLGDKNYKDLVDIVPEDIYKYQKETGILPKTGATNLVDTENFFRGLVDEGYTVIHFTLSSDFSSNYNTACAAAEEVGNVYVVDTRNLSSGGGLLTLYACDLMQQGLEAEKITEKCRKIVNNIDASFVIGSLEYLHKGGRCSSVAVLGANLLKLRPLVQVKDGKMAVSKKYRGSFYDITKQYITEKLADLDSIVGDRVFITHSGVDEKICNDMRELVKSYNKFKEVYVTRASCTISSHCGDECIGILFIRNREI